MSSPLRFFAPWLLWWFGLAPLTLPAQSDERLTRLERRLADATSEMERAVTLDSLVTAYLGMDMARCDQYLRLLEQITRLLEQAPGANGLTLENLGTAYYQRGGYHLYNSDYAAAFSSLLNALRVFEKTADTSKSPPASTASA